jgi:hypothetical protein
LNLQTPQLQTCRAHGAKTPARNLVSRGSLVSRLELTANHAKCANGQLLPCQSGAEAMQSRRSALAGRYRTARSVWTAARLPPLLSWQFDDENPK